MAQVWKGMCAGGQCGGSGARLEPWACCTDCTWKFVVTLVLEGVTCEKEAFEFIHMLSNVLLWPSHYRCCRALCLSSCENARPLLCDVRWLSWHNFKDDCTIHLWYKVNKTNFSLHTTQMREGAQKTQLYKHVWNRVVHVTSHGMRVVWVKKRNVSGSLWWISLRTRPYGPCLFSRHGLARTKALCYWRCSDQKQTWHAFLNISFCLSSAVSVPFARRLNRAFENAVSGTLFAFLQTFLSGNTSCEMDGVSFGSGRCRYWEFQYCWSVEETVFLCESSGA